MTLFPFIPGYEDQIVESGRQPILVALVAFVIAFALTRGYTRAARVRGWGSASAGGVHVHHVLVGILLVLGAGVVMIGFRPDRDTLFNLALCAAFGVGAAFILDEFALVFHLEDVYWAEEGRSSVDAVIIALGIGALALLHAIPFQEEEGARQWALATWLALHIALVVVVIAKGKLLTALLGAFVPLLLLVASIRLAKPRSPWARRFYGDQGRRHARSEARFARHDRRWLSRRRRVEELIGGAPGSER